MIDSERLTAVAPVGVRPIPFCEVKAHVALHVERWLRLNPCPRWRSEGDHWETQFVSYAQSVLPLSDHPYTFAINLVASGRSITVTQPAWTTDPYWAPSFGLEFPW